MSEQPSVPAGVVPYVECYTGARRVLTVTMDTRGMGGPRVKARICPTVSIDGRPYVVYWGEVHFEIPAERPVHVAVALQDGVQAASTLVPVGADARIHYVADRSMRPTLTLS
jgi:hypothetical protein